MNTLPTRRCWTREEYYQALESGIFRSDERLELIEGDLITMPPMLTPHAVCTMLTEEALRSAFTGDFCFRVQMPLSLEGNSEPEPDIVVAFGKARDYLAAHPGTAALVVEVSDSTLAYDRTTKTGLYARAGIADFWILNLPQRMLEVHRQPAMMPEMPLGYGYRTITRLLETETIAPLNAPEAVISVASLLPLSDNS